MDIDDLLDVWMEAWDPNLSEELQNRFLRHQSAWEIIDGLKGTWSKAMVSDAVRSNKRLSDAHKSLIVKIHSLENIPRNPDRPKYQ